MFVHVICSFLSLRFLDPKPAEDKTKLLFTNLSMQGLSERLVMHVWYFLAFENMRIDKRILLAHIRAKEDYRSWESVSYFIHCLESLVIELKVELLSWWVESSVILNEFIEFARSEPFCLSKTVAHYFDALAVIDWIRMEYGDCPSKAWVTLALMGEGKAFVCECFHNVLSYWVDGREDIKLLKTTKHVKFILNYLSSMENKGTGKR
jgi:hypothetical protein